MKKTILTWGIMFIVLMMNVMPIQAAGGATVSFTENKKLEYSNVSTEGKYVNLGSAFEGVAPGESRSQTITIQNNYKKTADFYMSTEVVEALESNTTKARGAGYEIKLTAGDAVLYDSKAGGYSSTKDSSASSAGIAKMNDTLDGYVLIATLKKGETSDVVLNIAFDGEAMDNTTAIDYSWAEGQLAFEFKVGYEEPTGTTTVYKEITKKGENKYVNNLVNIIENAVPLAAVATGDASMIGLAVVVLFAGVAFVTVGRKKRKEE